MNIWLIVDAIGLGVFSIIGASVVFQIFGIELSSNAIWRNDYCNWWWDIT